MTIPRNLSFLAQGASSTGVLSVPYGGTGLTTLTANYIPYGAGASAFASNANFTYTSGNLLVGGTSNAANCRILAENNTGQQLGARYTGIATYYLSVDSSGNCNLNRDSTVFTQWFSSGGVSIGNTTDPGATNLSVTGTGTFGSNINVNTTLSAWGLGNVLQLAGGSIWAANTSNIGTVQNIYYDGSVFKYINTIGASYLQQSAGNYYFQTAPSGTAGNTATLTTVMQIANSGGVSIGNTTDPGASNLSVTGTIASASTIKTAGYTVATLPTGVTGARAYVTNALAPTYGATVVGGGAVTIPVFYNGANWICA